MQLIVILDWCQRCYAPVSRGPCKAGELLMAGVGAVARCQPVPCAEDEVWGGPGRGCLPLHGTPGCAGRGERLWWRAGGGADCDCREGWGRHNGSCVQEGAPCGEGGVYQRPPSQPCSSGTCIPYTECPAFIQVQMHYKISPFNEL